MASFHRRPTSTGFDLLPSWFLKLGAPVFSKPLAELFNLSIATSTVPSQWKEVYIKPVPKLAHPSHFGFPTSIDYACTDQDYGATYCPTVSLSCHRVIMNSSTILRSVCFPAKWISYRCYKFNTSNCHTPPHRQPICYCYLFRFRQGV